MPSDQKMIAENEMLVDRKKNLKKNVCNINFHDSIR